MKPAPSAGPATVLVWLFAFVAVGVVAQPRPSETLANESEPSVGPSTRPGRAALRAGTAISLRTGFVPDPLVIAGEIEPRTPMERFGAGCVGTTSIEPAQRISLDGRFAFLRIFTTGVDDLTLAVETPRGTLCSDDRFGRHPSVEGRFGFGELLVWVGVKNRSEGQVPFVLEVTETRSIRPGVRRGEEGERQVLAVEAGLAVEVQRGTSGDIRLRRGFLPDPRFLEGRVDASRELVDLGGLGEGCRGFVPREPSHVVTLRDEFDFFQIYVLDAPREAAALVVIGPDGEVHCDYGDGDAVDVSRRAWPAGLARVWVGARRRDVSFPYRLGLSEIRRVR